MSKPQGRIPVAEWKEKVQHGGMADYEGYGYAVIDGHIAMQYMLVPSWKGKDIPEGTTEVEWYKGM